MRVGRRLLIAASALVAASLALGLPVGLPIKLPSSAAAKDGSQNEAALLAARKLELVDVELIAMAGEHLRRKEPDPAFERLVAALVEARRGDTELLAKTTERAAAAWAAR